MQLRLWIKVQINKPTGCVLIFYMFVQVSSPYKLTGNFIASNLVAIGNFTYYAISSPILSNIGLDKSAITL